MKKHIAFVEDDDVIRENYAEILAEEGFDVDAFSDRQAAMERFKEWLPDLVILDIGLGEERDAGFQLCTELRRLSAKIPIIFLTSHDSEMDKISGMRLGADDYLTKDTSIDYLVVRIETLFRRVESLTQGESISPDQPPAHRLVRGDLTIDMDRCVAYWKDSQVDLTLTQWWIVQELAIKPGNVKSHSKLMSTANIVVEPNTIAAHIKTIRNRFKAIDKDFDCIKTEYGIGYRWINS